MHVRVGDAHGGRGPQLAARLGGAMCTSACRRPRTSAARRLASQLGAAVVQGSSFIDDARSGLRGAAGRPCRGRGRAPRRAAVLAGEGLRLCQEGYPGVDLWHHECAPQRAPRPAQGCPAPGLAQHKNACGVAPTWPWVIGAPPCLRTERPFEALSDSSRGASPLTAIPVNPCNLFNPIIRFI